MMHMRRLLALTTAVLALAPAAAQAASWTAPQTVSQPHTFAGPLLVADTAQQAVVAAWPWQDNVGDDARGGESFAVRPPGAGAFGPEGGAISGLVDVRPYAQTRWANLAVRGTPRRDRATGVFLAQIAVSFSALSSRVLATVPLSGRPQLASAPSGATALVTWIEVTKTSSGAIRRVVRAIDRRAGRWGKAYTLSGRGRSDVVSAAASARGDQVVAFVRQGKVLVRVRRAGHGWGSIQTLATATGPTQWQLATGVNARGQVRVVWRRHELRTRTALESAALLVGRGRFTAAQTLTANGASATFHLTETPQGWAVADVEGDRPILHRTAGGSQFLPGLAAAPAQAGTRGADVAFSPVGGITVAWVVPVAGQDGDGVARAATLPTTGSAFGPVEDVTPAEAVHEVRLAVDGRAGQPVAVWTARPEGTGPGIPVANIRTVVRSALRLP
jgi:hypothetical protein